MRCIWRAVTDRSDDAAALRNGVGRHSEPRRPTSLFRRRAAERRRDELCRRKPRLRFLPTQTPRHEACRRFTPTGVWHGIVCGLALHRPERHRPRLDLHPRMRKERLERRVIMGLIDPELLPIAKLEAPESFAGAARLEERDMDDER